MLPNFQGDSKRPCQEFAAYCQVRWDIHVQSQWAQQSDVTKRLHTKYLQRVPMLDDINIHELLLAVNFIIDPILQGPKHIP